MTAYNSVFKRVEKKYRIDVAERAAVEAAAERLMAVDDYGRTRITSLYLDTPERAMIARSVEKPLYKEKLRLRAYGDAAGVALMGAFGAGPIVREPGGLPLSDGEVETRVAAGLRVARTAAGLQVAPAAAGLQTMGDADGDAVGSVEACRPCAGEALRGNGLSAGFPVFFGIKKKFKGIVYKRRVGCSYAAARAYLGGVPYEEACARFPLVDPMAAAESCAPRSLQIAAEIDRFMTWHAPLVPSMLIRCERVAYVPVLDALSGQPPADVPSDLRITFDECVAYRDLFAAPAVPTSGSARALSALLRADESVMEIKASGSFPLWLVAALDACRAYPTSFSKYGAAYRACMSAPAVASAIAQPAAEVSATARVDARAAHAHAVADQKAGCLAVTLLAGRPRRFRATTSAKKGGCCA